MKKSLSLLIPVYNCYKYFLDCINSISSQDCKPDEVIVCDQSNDGNSFLIEQLCNKNSFIYLRQDTPCLLKARINLVRHCHSDYFSFIDSDDMITNNYVKIIKENLNQNNDILIFGWGEIDSNGHLISVDASSNIFKICNVALNNTQNIDIFKKQLITTSLMHRVWNKVYKTEKFVYADFEPYFESKLINMGEDFVFCSLFSNNATTISFLNDNLYLYRNNNESLTHKFNIKHWKDYNLLFERYNDFFSYNIDTLTPYKNYFLNNISKTIYYLILSASSDLSNYKNNYCEEFKKNSLVKSIFSFLKNKKCQLGFLKKKILLLFEKNHYKTINVFNKIISKLTK